jgi:hypothetical protein
VEADYFPTGKVFDECCLLPLPFFLFLTVSHPSEPAVVAWLHYCGAVGTMRASTLGALARGASRGEASTIGASVG